MLTKTISNISKTKKYTRCKKVLLDDLYEIIKSDKISPASKFYFLRNDFLSTWTKVGLTNEDTEERFKIGNPFWTESAIASFKENGLKNIQHDHIVPKLWFEEVIMNLINENNQCSYIPKGALELLFNKLAFGAVVTADENQRYLDKEEQKNGKWKKKENRYWGMPREFLTVNHSSFLNPWSRYIESKRIIKVRVIDWRNIERNKRKDYLMKLDCEALPMLDYDLFNFDRTKLSSKECMYFNWWEKVFKEKFGTERV